jgi:hypothetical protein
MSTRVRRCRVRSRSTSSTTNVGRLAGRYLGTYGCRGLAGQAPG